MAEFKIYNKRGQPNHKEKLLIKKLTEHFEKNPDKYEGYNAPSDYEDLKVTHDHYCIEEAQILGETKYESTHDDFLKAAEDSVKKEKEQPELFPQEDPMNREEPNIRNYVTDVEFSEDKNKKFESSSYAEPTSFKDSFEIPGAEQIRNEPINNPPPKNTPKPPPDPDAKIKRKSKRKFTKYAVDAVCALAGRGIVWYATKDITNEALQNAVVNDEISEASLKVLVYLDHSTQGTVKQFFELHIVKSQQLATFSQEEKDDLAEALEDFLEYKNIQINPTINVGVVFVGMVFERALAAMQLKAEVGSILTQLKQMHLGEVQKAHVPPPPPTPQPEPQAEEEKKEEVNETEPA